MYFSSKFIPFMSICLRGEEVPECPICMDRWVDPVVHGRDGCGGTFCRECVDRWLVCDGSNHSCPLCHRPCTINDFVPNLCARVFSKKDSDGHVINGKPRPAPAPAPPPRPQQEQDDERIRVWMNHHPLFVLVVTCIITIISIGKYATETDTIAEVSQLDIWHYRVEGSSYSQSDIWEHVMVKNLDSIQEIACVYGNYSWMMHGFFNINRRWFSYVFGMDLAKRLPNTTILLIGCEYASSIRRWNYNIEDDELWDKMIEYSWDPIAYRVTPLERKEDVIRFVRDISAYRVDWRNGNQSVFIHG